MRLPRFDDKDPSDVDDYGYDFAAELHAETIVSETVTIEPSGELTAGTPWVAEDSVVGVRLSGGVEGQSYRVTYTIVTSGGRTLERSLSLLVSQL